MRCANPTLSSAAFACSCRFFAPAYIKGSSTFLMADVRGNRLNVWNTKPTYLHRMSASALSLSRDTSWRFRKYSPAVGRSRQPITFMKVDLPEPEGPMIATNSPGSTFTSTPCNAWTTVSPMM